MMKKAFDSPSETKLKSLALHLLEHIVYDLDCIEGLKIVEQLFVLTVHFLY